MNYQGLSSPEVKELQTTYGPNKLPEKKPPTELEIFFSQLKSPLVYVLLVAAAITFFLHQYEDTIIIGVAVLINTILGYYQESKAGKALEALKKLLQATTRVIRDGTKQEITTEKLVPGDYILLKSGEKIPADGKVIESNRFFVIEAMLTGEPDPIQKNTDDKIFMGTIVKGGHAVCVVEKIGASTEVGKIAQDIQAGETVTPLQRQLETFSKQLSYIVLGVTIVVFLVGILEKEPIADIFTTAVALAVGAIPEGLLVALTVVLTIGMQKILKRKGLVKNLVSAETLGGVTVICSDKTGTLTHGTMRVEKVLGDEENIARQAYLANDNDNAVALSTGEWAKAIIGDKVSDYQKIDSIPFSSENKFLAALYEKDGNQELYVNGAPEYLLQWSDLDEATKKKQLEEIEELTTLGYRVIGYAMKTITTNTTHISEDLCRSGLTRVGAVGLIDPVREDVKDALHKTKTAGIKMIVITGDYARTAKYVMHQLDIDVDEKSVILGNELQAMSDEQLDERLEHDSHVKLFARTQPEQKMRIVEALKRDGEIVAMMGDGVNDAPALKRADIGIVVGEATDVAKESADLILLDSSFSTIVAAVEEGRGMFDNIRKIILYLMSDAFVEISAILLAMILRYPLPIIASQILWINLVSDGFPNLALTVDPARKGIMHQPPKSPQEPLVANWIKKLIALVSILGGIGCFLIFAYILNHTNDIHLARSVAFVTCGINSLVYVFSIRTLGTPMREENPFNNKWLLIAVLGGFGFLVAPFIFTGLGNFLDIVPIGIYWLHATGIAVILVAVIEFYKWKFKSEFTAKKRVLN